jgi:hypothetical protein
LSDTKRRLRREKLYGSPGGPSYPDTPWLDVLYGLALIVFSVLVVYGGAAVVVYLFITEVLR